MQLEHFALLVSHSRGEQQSLNLVQASASLPQTGVIGVTTHKLFEHDVPESQQSVLNVQLEPVGLQALMH